jgi:hypothetical protein
MIEGVTTRSSTWDGAEVHLQAVHHLLAHADDDLQRWVDESPQPDLDDQDGVDGFGRNGSASRTIPIGRDGWFHQA